MQKNLDIVSESTAEIINARNTARQTVHTRRKRGVRMSIEEHQAAKALKLEMEDGIGLTQDPVRKCLNCGTPLKDKPPTAKFCKENCRKSYWKRGRKL